MTALKLLLLAVLLVPHGAAAAPAVPGDTAQGALDAWLAAHNAGQREGLDAFNARYGIARDVQADLDFHETFGQLRLIETRRSTPTSVEALLVSEWGRGLLLRIGIAPDAPQPLTKMEFEGAPVPDAFRPAPMPLDALAAEVKRRLDAREAEGALSGSMLLARNGRPLFAWHGGLADRESMIAVSAATRFRMASLGKMITAVAILQLADAGRLSLDDRLSKHLADYPNQDVADAITLRQLLNHTSGTGEVFGERFAEMSGSLRTHRDYWNAFADTPLAFEPGSRDRYSNLDYILLGSVIEAVSGQSYYDYVETHVYRPAGMTSTGSAPESEHVPQRAHAYTKVDGAWTRETASLPWRGTAAGGGYTTADDLLRFARALQDGTLLSAGSLQLATRPQNHKAWYGYGFMVDGEGARRQFGHEGGAPGTDALINIVPAAGYVVIGLSNGDPSTMANIVNFMTQRLP